jgi:hypothetical protein
MMQRRALARAGVATLDCGSLLPLCCHSLLWSQVPPREPELSSDN